MANSHLHEYEEVKREKKITESDKPGKVKVALIVTYRCRSTQGRCGKPVKTLQLKVSFRNA